MKIIPLNKRKHQRSKVPDIISREWRVIIKHSHYNKRIIEHKRDGQSQMYIPHMRKTNKDAHTTDHHSSQHPRSGKTNKNIAIFPTTTRAGEPHSFV